MNILAKGAAKHLNRAGRQGKIQGRPSFHWLAQDGFMGEQRNPLLGFGVILVASSYQIMFPVRPLNEPSMAEGDEDSGWLDDAIHFHAGILSGDLDKGCPSQGFTCGSEDWAKAGSGRTEMGLTEGSKPLNPEFAALKFECLDVYEHQRHTGTSLNLLLPSVVTYALIYISCL
jgi:hypothetical protein